VRREARVDAVSTTLRTTSIDRMTQSDAEAIAGWRYEPPYDFYDANSDERDLAELLDAGLRGEKYFAAHDEHGDLIGFFAFTTHDGVVNVGVGLRPDLTGLGLGLPFLERGLDFARGRFAPSGFRLTVAEFNRRAIIVYERAGFVATRSFPHDTNGGTFQFVEMECSA
jgi:[ribosomal protein S18]-alanine N-acetyltransferase